MKNLLKRLWKDESGLTALEYALIAGAITAGVVTIFSGLGTKANTSLGKVNNSWTVK